MSETCSGRPRTPRRSAGVLGAPCLAWAAALLMLGAAGLASAEEPRPSVEFLSPRHLSTVLGPTEISLRVIVPPGARVDRVVVTVDGSEIAALEAPPWSVVWDAGDGASGHRLVATLLLADGNRKIAAVRTSPLRINQVEEVGLVSLYPIVRDARGAYVADLGRGDFSVFEDGVPQRLSRFSTENKPLRIAVVLDTSLSMSRGSRLVNAQQAAVGLLDIINRGDEGMVVTFNDTVDVVQELTSDVDALSRAIRSTKASGGTALYDAIWRTSRALREFDGRRVLVLLSDGKDEAASGLEPGSLHSLDEALDQALRSEVMVFAIGLGRNLDRLLDFDRRNTLDEILVRLADATGGRALISPRAGQLRRAFREVAEDLRNQYSLAYASSNPKSDGTWRRLEVLVPGRTDVEVVCREGYFAAVERTPDPADSDGGG